MGNKKGLSFLAKPLFLLVVLGAGLEPAHLAARDFKSELLVFLGCFYLFLVVLKHGVILCLLF
ncbi:hypothetical protein K4H28_01530 [Deefgea tanakiae]|uniref:Uncharacterized protein n=1 Tax=Deefgea tanakiae TaxID=2865840 RepID=A0ABX8Z6D4_9NEIS|nr:hypothetical protein [Deefgea tanakiae]QZA78142.1 hypothetical protein K4H28_01530 [Deefgea tanakiae]